MTGMPEALELAVETSGRLKPYRGRAYSVLKRVTLYHRIQGGRGLLEAAEDLERLILEDAPEIVETTSFAYTGKTGPEWLPLPVRWDVYDAMLKTGSNTYTLVGHPTLAAAHSPPSEGEVRGEALILRDPLDVDAYSHVKGKIVVATKHYRLAYRLAAENGASAVILARDTGSPQSFPYIGLFLTEEEAGKYTIPAITAPLSLARSLEGRSVTVKVDAEIGGPGRLPVVVAWIGDKNGPGPVLTAHLCHPKPGANDNASGVSAGVEAFLSLAEAIDTGMLPMPEQTVRLVLMPEYTGTILSMEGWLNELATSNINLDMVGASQREGVEEPAIYYPPLTAPETLAAETLGLSALIIEGDANVRTYMYGSDHDVFHSYGKPAVMVNQWPDPHYHTDADDADKIDPARLEGVAHKAATALHLLASRDWNPPPLLAGRIVEALSLRRTIEHDNIGLRLARFYAARAYGMNPDTSPPMEWKPDLEGTIRPVGPRLLLLPEAWNIDAALNFYRGLENLDPSPPTSLVYGEILFHAWRNNSLSILQTLVAASYGVRMAEVLGEILGLAEDLGIVRIAG